MSDIFFDLSDMCHIYSDEYDEFWQIEEAFDLDWNNDHMNDIKQYGCFCTNCGEFYPYAEVIENFKCWGCRNF